MFSEIDEAATALVVIDMQNVFMLPGVLGEIPFGREIVPNVNALAEAVRAAGGIVAWVQMALRQKER